MPVTAYIGIGSNVGDKKANCRKAVELLAAAGRIAGASSLYRTEPVGYELQNDFINAAVALETDCSPFELLSVCRSIEDKLGRTRAVRWGPRTIDLDILLYGDLVLDAPDLVIPHPRMAARGFVLAPLAELAPDAVHPVFQKTVAGLFRELKDPHAVKRCAPDGTTT
jgi:2-amino-4-hydroxy-6-hydroxymethyldihydropteridine diphosphokinase